MGIPSAPVGTPELTAINQAFHRCTSRGWKGFDEQLESLATQNLTWSTRNQRATSMEKKRTQRVGRACHEHVDAMGDALVSLIETRNAKRTAIFAAAKKLHG